MLRRDFEPGFYVEHFIKDLGIALEEARRMKLGLPGLGLASQLYQALGAQGFERKGTQALLLALESMNGVQIKKYDIWLSYIVDSILIYLIMELIKF